MFTSLVQAESFLYFQNNTSSDVQVSTSSTLGSAYWVNSFSGTSEAWRLKTKVLEVNRNVGISNNTDFYLTSSIIIDGQTVDLKLKLTGTFTSSDIWCSASGPGFTHPWYDDYAFHDASFAINGMDYILKYQFDFVAGNIYADAYFVLHEVDAFEPDTTELTDPHILNVLSYNLYMLTPPIGSSEETQRAKIVHKYIEGYDIVILNEVFYNSARNDELIPRLSLEYPFHSNVVDAPNALEDGGVMIFSRWPIVNEDQMVYSVCDGSDCLSNKGVMYTEINKLGKPYHVFGTHTQAWPDPTSISVRLEQLGEMYAFMESQNIPTDEAVIFGGDMNVNKANSNQNLEYIPMLDTLHVSEPQYLGHDFTYDSDYNNYASGSDFEYLDFVFSENTHFCAYAVSNEPLILRHVESDDDFWDNNSLDLDLSDHYAVHGRLEYPYFTQQPNTLSTCANENFQLNASINKPGVYQWYANGQLIVGANNAVLTHNVSSSTSFYCSVDYGCGSIISNTVQVNVLPSPATPTLSVYGSSLIVSNASSSVAWYVDNILIPGVLSLSYSTCVSGTYYVQIVGTNACLSLPSNSVNYQGNSVSPLITLNNDTLYSSEANGNQWYNSQGPISGATDAFFSSCDADDYYVIATNGNCVSLASNSIFLDISPAAPMILENNGVLWNASVFGTQWYDVDGPLLGEDNESFLPLADGTYYVTTFNGKCISVLSDPYNYTATGVLNREGALGLRIKNNPIINHELIFDLSMNSNGQLSLAVYNNIGRRVYFDKGESKGLHTTRTIPLNHLTPGIYFLQIEVGGSSISRKFLIKE